MRFFAAHPAGAAKGANAAAAPATRMQFFAANLAGTAKGANAARAPATRTRFFAANLAGAAATPAPRAAADPRRNHASETNHAFPAALRRHPAPPPPFTRDRV